MADKSKLVRSDDHSLKISGMYSHPDAHATNPTETFYAKKDEKGDISIFRAETPNDKSSKSATNAFQSALNIENGNPTQVQALTAGAAQAYEKTLAQNGIRCKDGMYAFTGRMSQYSNQDHIFPIRNAQMPDKGELARIDERCKREICYENIKKENPDMSPELARAELAKEISARSKGLPSKVTDAKVPTPQELIEKNPSPNLPVKQEQQSLTRETPDLTASVRSRRSFVQDLHRNAMSTASRVPAVDRASAVVKSVETANTFRPELNASQSSVKDLVRSKQPDSATKVISAPDAPGIHVDTPKPNFDNDFQGDTKSQESKEPKAQEAEAPKRNWSRFSKGMSAGAPSLGDNSPSFDNGFNK